MKHMQRIWPILMALFNRGGGMVMQFGSTWILARSIGAAGMGAWSFYNAWMQVIAAAAGIGSITYTLRTVAVLHQQGAMGEIRRYVWQMGLTLIGTGLFCVLMLQFVDSNWLLRWIGDSQLLPVLDYAAWGGMAFMVLKLLSEALKSMGRVNTAMVFESMLLPGLIIALCAVMWGLHRPLEAGTLFFCHIVFCWLICALMSQWVLKLTQGTDAESTQNSTPPPIAQAAPAPSANRVFNPALLPMWGSALLNMLFLNMPLLLLPSFASAHELGVFSIAYRFITICINLLVVIAGFYGPRFAQDYAVRDVGALREGLFQTQKWSLLLYMPLFLLFILAPNWLLGLFGREFKDGGTYLVIMAIGQLAYSSTGLAGFMMNMIHREREEFFIMMGSTVAMALLIVGGGHWYGAMGVAVGFAIGMGFNNIASMIAARHYLNKIPARQSLGKTGHKD